MKPISEDAARALGVEAIHHEMENGERRFRLVSSDGSSYSRTEASGASGWQNSHYHQRVTELYVVQKGWIAYAELSADGELTISLLQQGGTVTVRPYTHHNVYMSAFAVTHVVKYGDGAEKGTEKADWFPSPALDLRTKPVTESELLHQFNPL